MRFLSITVVSLLVLGTPAFALSEGDTMQAWSGASSTEKDALLRTLDAASGGDASRNRVRACLDETSSAAGHSNLPISDVAKACAEQAARENI